MNSRWSSLVVRHQYMPLRSVTFLPEKMKVRGKRKRISPRTMNERVILMKRKVRKSHAMTLLWSRWREIWKLWTRNSSVEISTGLLVDPLVGLRILRGSSSRKMMFRLFLY